MTPPENPFAELAGEYVAECLPLTEEVVERAIRLERECTGGVVEDQDFPPLKGLLHTIKGNSAMMGLTPLQGLAHALEDLVGLLATEPAARSAGAALLARGAGLLADLVRGVAAGPLPEGLSDDFIEETRAFLAADPGSWDSPRVERRGDNRRHTERRSVAAGELGSDGAVRMIRVDSVRMDALLESFGEAMIAQAGLRDAARALLLRQRGSAEAALMEQAMLGLDRTLKRLEGARMETRLRPVATLFGRFTRQVRDLAHAEADGQDAGPRTITNIVEARQGSVIKVDHWGRRRMAYPIKGMLDADYVITRVMLEPEKVRDVETAEIAIQAALTGHLVFSTLHTNDAAGAITRLVDMGIEPFLVASVIRAIVAQRLVRVICPECKGGYVPEAEVLREAGIEVSFSPGQKAYRGKGCPACSMTGYRGRTGIYEILRISEEIRQLIMKKADSATIGRRATVEGMKTLRDDGARKVMAGVTTLEEVLRVTKE